MQRMVGRRAGCAQDPAFAPGVGDAARDLALELVDRHVVRAGGDEEEAARGDGERIYSAFLTAAWATLRKDT